MAVQLKIMQNKIIQQTKRKQNELRYEKFIFIQFSAFITTKKDI